MVPFDDGSVVRLAPGAQLDVMANRGDAFVTTHGSPKLMNAIQGEPGKRIFDDLGSEPVQGREEGVLRGGAGSVRAPGGELEGHARFRDLAPELDPVGAAVLGAGEGLAVDHRTPGDLRHRRAEGHAVGHPGPRRADAPLPP